MRAARSRRPEKRGQPRREIFSGFFNGEIYWAVGPFDEWDGFETIDFDL